MDRRNVEAILPLTPMQESLLFNTLRARDVDPGVLQLRCTLAGQLDAEAFRHAWAAVVARHATLRASVHWEEVERPLQVVWRHADPSWAVEDWRGLTTAERQARLDGLLRAERERGLDLSRAPVMRLALARTSEDEWELIWSCHHVLLDGWSGAIVLGEVVAAHDALRDGAEPRLPPARSYGEYVAWLRQRESSEAEAFWRAALSGLCAPTPLPAPAGASGDGDGASGFAEVSLVVPAAATAAVVSCARQHRLTLGTVVQGAWAALLGAHGGETDVCFGATVSGRGAPVAGIESMVGLFINALPVRVQLGPGDGSVVAFLRHVREQQAALRRYEHVALAQVQRWSDVPGGRRLFESLVVVENFPARAVGGGGDGRGRRLAVRDLRGGITTGYPLTLVAVPGESLALGLVYDCARIAPASARRLLDELRALVEAMAARPGARLAEVLPVVRRDGARAPAAPPAPRAARPEHVAPADAIELQLAQIWERVLGVHPVGVRDDFFDLGGHSLTAAQLFAQIERVLGTRLPLATLFEAPTVEQLARRLRDRGWTPPWSSLVALQPEGDGIPLFCIHSYEGHLLFYRDLARRLAPDQPVFGLQAVGLDGAEPLARVEEMAEHYLREVRAVRPRGPYLLVGMCFGISVAFEMAQQLRAQGEDATELIMLDSSFLTRLPVPVPELPRTRTGRLLRRLRRHAGVAKRRSLRALDHLGESPSERRARRVREGNEQAWYAYDAQVYPGRITLIRSAEYGTKQDWHLEIWSELAAGGVQCHTVPGDHVTMLHEPHVRHLADRLRACAAANPIEKRL